MELIEKLIKLNVLYVREMERRNILKAKFHNQMWEPILRRKPNCTVMQSVQFLKDSIDRNSKIDYLKQEIAKLENDIDNSDIKDLRYWDGKDLSNREEELAVLALKRMLFMLSGMVGIKNIVEMLGLTESAVKQACQQERLLNTRKIGNNWMVHIPECRAYWNILDTDARYAYKDWEY